MSAFVVSDAHINTLVSWASFSKREVRYFWQGGRRHVWNDEKRIASVLYAENVRSVNARYQESTPTDGFQYRFRLGPFPALMIIKACHGYAYQTCETEDWEATEAYAIIKGIEDAAMRALPGYDESPGWGIIDEPSKGRS